MNLELVATTPNNATRAKNLSSASRTLIAESNHRIANNLSLIAGLVRLRASTLATQATMRGDEVRLILEEVCGCIETVGRLHRLLGDPNRGEAVDLGDYLRDIAEAIVSALSFAGPAMLSNTSTADCILPPDQALSIGLIVSEMVTNAVKYAHPTGVRGKIRVGCHRADGRLVVEVTDDGVGLPEGFDPMTQGGLGLRLVRSLADQLGAKPMFDHSCLGLRFRLLLPAQGMPGLRKV